MTEEHKRKLSEAQKGRVFTLEHRRKLSAAHKGKVTWNKGIPHSEETRRNISRANTGHIAWNKGKKGCTPWNKGKLLPLAIRERQSLSHKGKRLSTDHKKAISLGLIGKFVGENNPAWRGGTSTERERLMGSLNYRAWREAVFSRDDFRCFDCGTRTGPLNAHHLYSWALFPRLRFVLENGITLCVPCHKNTDTYLKKSKVIKIPGMIFSNT